jgi:putative monooxygenase
MSGDPLATASGARATAHRRHGGELRVLLSPATTGGSAGFLATLTLAPGEAMSEHYHPYSDEFLYVVRGAVTVRGDGPAACLGADEAVLIPRGRRHRIENTGADQALCALVMAPLAPSPELGHVDTEPVPAPDEPPARVGGAG